MFKSEMSTHRFMHSNTWLVFGGAAGGAYGSLKVCFVLFCLYLLREQSEKCEVFFVCLFFTMEEVHH